MRIKVWEDFVCPYCYIGMKHLEEAAMKLGIGLEIEVLSFELEPERPEGAEMTLYESLMESCGVGEAEAAKMFSHSVSLAEEAGLPIEMAKAKVNSTHRAHRLLQYAKSVDAAKGKVFFQKAQRGYFAEGRSLEDPAFLLEAAEAAGLGRAEAEQVLADEGAFAEEVREEQAAAEARQINYVPYFIFPSGYFIEGVLGEEDFVKALEAERA